MLRPSSFDFTGVDGEGQIRSTLHAETLAARSSSLIFGSVSAHVQCICTYMAYGGRTPLYITVQPQSSARTPFRDDVHT